MRAKLIVGSSLTAEPRRVRRHFVLAMAVAAGIAIAAAPAAAEGSAGAAQPEGFQGSFVVGHTARFQGITFFCGKLVEGVEVRRFIHSVPTTKYIAEAEPPENDPLRKSWLIVYRIICERNAASVASR